jgi:two-component system nitrate/nitrite response regulator NarL
MQMNAIPMFLIDPNLLFRQGLAALLVASDLRIAGECGDLRELDTMTEIAAEARLVLCDLDEEEVIQETVDRLRFVFQNARLVMMTGMKEPQNMLAALMAGMDGCVVKNISADALVQSLRLVLIGERVFPTQHLTTLLTRRDPEEETSPTWRKGLSPRETQILRCLVGGDSNKVIANRLGTAEQTVKVHLKSLLRKIGATNRTQAAVWAINNGVTQVDPKTVVA